MALSAPIFQLKRIGKSLSRSEKIPLNQALDRVAVEEGFCSWSALASSPSSLSSSARLFNDLEHGDLLLLGARPRQGKTVMALKVIVEAMKQHNKGVFFTLDYNSQDVTKIFSNIGVDPQKFDDLFEIDNSDSINAEYIIRRLEAAPRGTVVAIDYLQLLDQKRESPIVAVQVEALKSFARARDLILIFLTQIDRSYELSSKTFPDIQDVRLPNPLDMNSFDKFCFMNDGKIQTSVV